MLLHSVHKDLLSIKRNKKKNIRDQREMGLVSEQDMFEYWLLFWYDWLSGWTAELTDGKNKWVRKMSGEKTNTGKQ